MAQVGRKIEHRDSLRALALDGPLYRTTPGFAHVSAITPSAFVMMPPFFAFPSSIPTFEERPPSFVCQTLRPDRWREGDLYRPCLLSPG